MGKLSMGLGRLDSCRQHVGGWRGSDIELFDESGKLTFSASAGQVHVA